MTHLDHIKNILFLIYIYKNTFTTFIPLFYLWIFSFLFFRLLMFSVYYLNFQIEIIHLEMHNSRVSYVLFSVSKYFLRFLQMESSFLLWFHNLYWRYISLLFDFIFNFYEFFEMWKVIVFSFYLEWSCFQSALKHIIYKNTNDGCTIVQITSQHGRKKSLSYITLMSFLFQIHVKEEQRFRKSDR